MNTYNVPINTSFSPFKRLYDDIFNRDNGMITCPLVFIVTKYAEQGVLR